MQSMAIGSKRVRTNGTPISKGNIRFVNESYIYKYRLSSGHDDRIFLPGLPLFSLLTFMNEVPVQISASNYDSF